MKAYKGTSVNWAKSQTQITKLLNSLGIYESRFTNLQDKFALEFRVSENKKMLFNIGTSKGISVRIVVPFENFTDEKKREKELNSLHRVLFYHIKAKFVAIESGLTEFMEEFMPHLVILDKQGNSSTLGQQLLPQYKKAIDSGEQKGLNLLGDGK
ncbi:MAG: hypothetical protein WC933_03750 [Candidatus Paceibacterota bacterium]|jgi:hypothetical protein